MRKASTFSKEENLTGISGISKDNIKLKQSHYRSGQALSAPGS
jgi:hypothetical protein